MWKVFSRAAHPRHMLSIAALLLALTVVLSACQLPDPFVASGHASAISTRVAVAVSPTTPASNIPPGWQTFTDRGNDGFTISYPASWTFLPGYNAAHSSFVNSATSTVFSPTVSTVSQSPADVIAAATPKTIAQTQSHITVAQRQVAGYPAIDVFVPFIPTTFHAPNSGYALAANRTITLAIRNDSGTTNVYTFMVSLPVDKAGNMSAAVIADSETVDAMLATFQLPPTIGPVSQP